MTTADERLAILERFASGYPEAVNVAMAALRDGTTPPAAQRLLVGALNYALDQLDIFPDHYRGIGVADDAMVIRLAARQAVAAGATHEGLQKLAADTTDVEAVLEELTVPLDKYIARLPDRKVRGLSADQTIAMALEAFEADLQRHMEKHKPKPLDKKLSAEYHVGEMRRMIKMAMEKAGLLGG